MSVGEGLPIVLGVTGHRDLADPVSVDQALGHCLDELRALFPNSRFVVLSALAEGADRLFAKAALVRGMELVVPLPMPAADYEEDFPESVYEFRALCAQASSCFVVPGNVTHPSVNPREAAYARAGLFLVERAHIVVAVWDGLPARGLGGTAQIARMIDAAGSAASTELDWAEQVGAMALQSRDTLESPLMPLLWRVTARRQGQMDSDQALPANGVEISPLKVPTPMRHGLIELDKYNSAARTSKVAQEQSLTFTVHASRPLKQRFAAADALANANTVNVRLLYKCIFVVAAIAASSQAIYSGGWPNVGWLTIYLLALLAIMGAAAFIRRKRQRTYVIAWRTLAEALRIQHAWDRAGLQDNVAQHALPRPAHPALEWVRIALRGAAFPRTHSDEAGGIANVRADWIQGQIAYFNKSIQRRQLVVRRQENSSSLLFRIGLFLTAIALTERVLGEGPWLAAGGLTVVDLLIGLLPALAGLWAGFIEFAGYQDDIAEQERMLDLFKEGERRLNAELPVERNQSVIRALGMDALRENARWAVTQLRKGESPAP